MANPIDHLADANMPRTDGNTALAQEPSLPSWCQATRLNCVIAEGIYSNSKITSYRLSGGGSRVAVPYTEVERSMDCSSLLAKPGLFGNRGVRSPLAPRLKLRSTMLGVGIG